MRLGLFVVVRFKALLVLLPIRTIVVLHNERSLRSTCAGSRVEVVLPCCFPAAQEGLNVALAAADLASKTSTTSATISPEAASINSICVKPDDFKIYSWDVIVPKIIGHPILVSVGRSGWVIIELLASSATCTVGIIVAMVMISHHSHPWDIVQCRVGVVRAVDIGPLGCPVTCVFDACSIKVVANSSDEKTLLSLRCVLRHIVLHHLCHPILAATASIWPYIVWTWNPPITKDEEEVV